MNDAEFKIPTGTSRDEIEAIALDLVKNFLLHHEHEWPKVQVALSFLNSTAIGDSRNVKATMEVTEVAS